MRLITRGDADGLCCAVFLRIKESIDSIEFAHPKDMQDGKIKVTPNDIIANLPYHPSCGMWFDHHSSSEKDAFRNFRGNFRVAPSAARVVFEYYRDRALGIFNTVLEATDKIDSACLTMEDVVNPQGYILLFYTLDPRSGLGPFRDYFQRLMDWIITKPVDAILDLPDVKERWTRLLAEQQRFSETMQRHTLQKGPVIFTDLRKATEVPPGNRYFIYTLYPQGNVQMRIFNGKGNEFTVIALGHSIFNKTCTVDLGALCSKYGGGGLKTAATCQVVNEKAEQVIGEILTALGGS